MDIEKRFDNLFNLIVPSDGKAGTLEGEVIRAAMRIAYRFYNDGDLFNEGYGKLTCGGAAMFLLTSPELPEEFKLAMERNIYDGWKKREYKETFLNQLMKDTFHFVTERQPEEWEVKKDLKDCTKPPNLTPSDEDWINYPDWHEHWDSE